MFSAQKTLYLYFTVRDFYGKNMNRTLVVLMQNPISQSLWHFLS